MGRSKRHEPDILVMGGGNGAAAALRGMRGWEGVTSIATMTDNGGNSNTLRMLLGVPPPGDLRRHLTALSHHRSMAEFYERRRPDGNVIGNLALVDALRWEGDMERAIARVGRDLDVRATVLPILDDPRADLLMHHAGERIRGECTIDAFPVTDPKAYVEITPDVKAHPSALEAIRMARRAIIIPGGSLLTSSAAVLAPQGVKEAIAESNALLVHVANLQTEANTPVGQHVVDNVQTLENYTGRPFDLVLYNTSIGPNWDAPALGFEPDRFDEIAARSIGAPLAASNGHVLHNSGAVAAHLLQLIP